jgi:hypothetical protein
MPQAESSADTCAIVEGHAGADTRIATSGQTPKANAAKNFRSEVRCLRVANSWQAQDQSQETQNDSETTTLRQSLTSIRNCPHTVGFVTPDTSQNIIFRRIV